MTVSDRIAKDRELCHNVELCNTNCNADKVRDALYAALDLVEAAEAVIVERNESTYCKTCHGRTLDMSGIEKHKPWCPIPGLLDALSAYGGER